MENDFGTHSLTQILQNIKIIINYLFEIKQSDQNIISTEQNHGLNILLYMLQNSNIILNNLIKPPSLQNKLLNTTTNNVKQIFKPFAEPIKFLNEYLTPDLEEPNEINEINERKEVLDFGVDTMDFFKGNNIKIASNGIHELIDGKIGVPLQKDISEESNIKLVPSVNKDNQREYKFVVEDNNTPSKILKLSSDNSEATITPVKK